jgi:hypothetical protein
MKQCSKEWYCNREEGHEESCLAQAYPVPTDETQLDRIEQKLDKLINELIDNAKLSNAIPQGGSAQDHVTHTHRWQNKDI